MMLVQVESGGLGGGHEVIPGGLDAQLAQFLDVVLHTLGGIVGHEEVITAGFLQRIQQFQGEIVQTAAQIKRSVHMVDNQGHYMVCLKETDHDGALFYQT